MLVYLFSSAFWLLASMLAGASAGLTYGIVEYFGNDIFELIVKRLKKKNGPKNKTQS